MLSSIASEALGRLAAGRGLLRLVEAHEKSVGLGSGDSASRAGKGLVFVANYAAYEHVVTELVRALIRDVNARALTHGVVRAELMALALDGEFTSVIEGALKKTWAARSALLRKSRSSVVVEIAEGLFPKDGTQFRRPQIETIWQLFGLPDPILANDRLWGHLEEMVSTRNAIAHGSQAPEHVGGRFTAAEMLGRIDRTEELCTHLIGVVQTYTTTASPYV